MVVMISNYSNSYYCYTFRHVWKVDKCLTQDSYSSVSVAEERKSLIKLALKGNNTAIKLSTMSDNM